MALWDYKGVADLELPDEWGDAEAQDWFKKNSVELDIKLGLTKPESGFFPSMKRGAGSMWSLATEGFPGLVRSAMGDEEGAARNLEAHAQREKELSMLYPRLVQGVENVESVGDAWEYFKETLGEGLPSLLPSLLGGGVGAVIAKKFGEKAVAGLAAKAAAEAAAKRQVVGATLGGVAGGFPINAAETFAGVAEANEGEQRPGLALGVGAAKTALDSIGPVLAIRRAFGAEIADTVLDRALTKIGLGGTGLVKRTARGVAEGIAAEGPTEGAQEALDVLAENLIKDNPDVFNQKNILRMVNAGVGGAIVGGAMGAGSGIMSSPQEPGKPPAGPEVSKSIGQPMVSPEDRAAYFDAMQAGKENISRAPRPFDPDDLVEPKLTLDDKIRYIEQNDVQLPPEVGEDTIDNIYKLLYSRKLAQLEAEGAARPTSNTEETLFSAYGNDEFTHFQAQNALKKAGVNIDRGNTLKALESLADNPDSFVTRGSKKNSFKIKRELPVEPAEDGTEPSPLSKTAYKKQRSEWLAELSRREKELSFTNDLAKRTRMALDDLETLAQATIRGVEPTPQEDLNQVEAETRPSDYYGAPTTEVSNLSTALQDVKKENAIQKGLATKAANAAKQEEIQAAQALLASINGVRQAREERIKADKKNEAAAKKAEAKAEMDLLRAIRDTKRAIQESEKQRKLDELLALSEAAKDTLRPAEPSPYQETLTAARETQLGREMDEGIAVGTRRYIEDVPEGEIVSVPMIQRAQREAGKTATLDSAKAILEEAIKFGIVRRSQAKDNKGAYVRTAQIPRWSKPMASKNAPVNIGGKQMTPAQLGGLAAWATRVAGKDVSVNWAPTTQLKQEFLSRGGNLEAGSQLNGFASNRQVFLNSGLTAEQALRVGGEEIFHLLQIAGRVPPQMVEKFMGELNALKQLLNKYGFDLSQYTPEELAYEVPAKAFALYNEQVASGNIDPLFRPPARRFFTKLRQFFKNLWNKLKGQNPNFGEISYAEFFDMVNRGGLAGDGFGLHADTGTGPLAVKDLFTAPKVWYSRVEKAVREAKSAVLTGREWASWLKNQGLGQLEMEWIGLTNFLNERQEDKLPREVVAEYIKANEVQIKFDALASGKYRDYTYRESPLTNYRVMTLALPELTKRGFPYAESHGFGDDVFVHMRVGDRLIGNLSILSTEEIQSDMERTASRKGGYKPASSVSGDDPAILAVRAKIEKLSKAQVKIDEEAAALNTTISELDKKARSLIKSAHALTFGEDARAEINDRSLAAKLLAKSYLIEDFKNVFSSFDLIKRGLSKVNTEEELREILIDDLKKAGESRRNSLLRMITDDFKYEGEELYSRNPRPSQLADLILKLFKTENFKEGLFVSDPKLVDYAPTLWADGRIYSDNSISGFIKLIDEIKEKEGGNLTPVEIMNYLVDANEHIIKGDYTETFSTLKAISSEIKRLKDKFTEISDFSRAAEDRLVELMEQSADISVEQSYAEMELDKFEDGSKPLAHPFKGDKSLIMGVRRMFTYAAEEGYNALSFPGLEMVKKIQNWGSHTESSAAQAILKKYEKVILPEADKIAKSLGFKRVENEQVKQELPDAIVYELDPDAEGVQKLRQMGLPMADRTTNVNTPEFKRWFGDSKVVDANGKPLVVYHGTKADIREFSKDKIGSTDHGFFAEGFHFSADAELASGYADYVDGVGGNVIPVYLSLQNPYIWPADKQAFTNKEDTSRFTAELKAQGYDGVIFNMPENPIWGAAVPMQEIIVFSPTQIKSVFNRGTFDPKNPSILANTQQDPKMHIEVPSEGYRGGSLGYTAERLEREIHSSDYPGGRSKAYIAWINPRDFLDLTVSNQESRDQITKEAGALDIPRLRSQSQTPFLYVDPETGKVTGHEGRHRMIALYNAGIERVPVVLDISRKDGAKVLTPKPGMRLRNQYNTHESGFAHNLIPLNYDNIEQIRNEFGGENKTVKLLANKEAIREDIQRMDQAAKSPESGLEGVSGLFGTIGTYLFHPFETARRHPVTARMINAVVRKQELIHNYLSEMRQLAKPFMELKDKANVTRAAAILDYVESEQGLQAAQSLVQENPDGSWSIRVPDVDRRHLNVEPGILHLTAEETQALKASYDSFRKGLELLSNSIDKAMESKLATLTAPERSTVLKQLADLKARLGEMRRGFYVPHVRTGNYYLMVKGPDGKKEQFLMGTRKELLRVLPRLREMYPDYDESAFTTGVVNAKELLSGKLKGLQAVDAMLSAMGSADTAAFQDYVNALMDMAKAQELGGMLKKRENIPGYAFGTHLDTFLERGINNFQYRVAFKAATSETQQEFSNGYSDVMGSGDAALINWANRYKEGVESPKFEAHLMRSIATHWMLGMGNISSAALQLTQTLQTTLPLFISMGGTSSLMKGIKRFGSGLILKEVGMHGFVGGTMDFTSDNPPANFPGSREDWNIYRTLMKEGYLQPLNTQEMAADSELRLEQYQGMGARKLGHIWNRILSAGMSLFTAAESFNRHWAAFGAIEMWDNTTDKTLMEQNYRNSRFASLPFTKENFVKYVVDTSNLNMTRANQPDWMRNVMRAPTQFMAAPAQMFEFWFQRAAPAVWRTREGKAAVTVMFATTLMISGMMGAPGSEALKALIEKLYEKYSGGVKIDLEVEAQRFMEKVMGFSPEVATAVRRGVLRSTLGVEIGQRISLGDMLPMDWFKDPAVVSAGGPFVNVLAQRFTEASQHMAKDDPLAAAMAMLLPASALNYQKALKAQEEGFRNTKGTMLVKPEDVSSRMGYAQAMGFKPAEVANAQDYVRQKQMIENGVTEAKNMRTSQLANLRYQQIQASRKGNMEEANKKAAEFQTLFQRIRAEDFKKPPEMRLNIKPETVQQRVMALIRGPDNTKGIAKDKLPAIMERQRALREQNN